MALAAIVPASNNARLTAIVSSRILAMNLHRECICALAAQADQFKRTALSYRAPFEQYPFANHAMRSVAMIRIWYDDGMTKLLEEAIEKLRHLPPSMQDSAARALIMQLEEEPEPGDREAVARGRRDFEGGNFVTLEQWRHEMGLTDR